MASRIWITCDHEHLGPHLTRELPTAISNEGWCQGGRVLTEGEYVLIEKVVINPDVKEWPDKVLLALEGKHWTGIAETLDALAGGES